MSFLRRKSLLEVQKEATVTALPKTMGAFDLILLGLGAIIGTGIFVLTGLAAAEYAGPSIVFSFLLGAIACIFTALAYTELAALLPVAGGAYTYMYVSLGEIFAGVIGWTALMIFTFGSATVASGWSGYVVGMLNGFGIQIPEALTKIPSQGGLVNLPAVVITVFLTLFLIKGMSGAAKLNGILVFVKLAAIIVFVLAAAPHVDMANWSNFAPNGFMGIAAGAGFVFMAYTGFDTLATAVEECKNPNRDLPIGIVGSLVGCAILYIIVSGLLTAIVPYTTLNNSESMAAALRFHGVGLGAKLVATGAIAGMTTVLLTQIYAQSRVLYVMARDRMIPTVFLKLHRKYSTPHIGIYFTGFVVSLICGFLPVAMLGQIASMATLMVFAFVSLSVMVMRYRYPDAKRTFRCPAVYVVATLSCLLCSFLFIQLLVENWKPYLLATACGLAIYLVYGYRNSQLRLSNRA